MRGEYPPILPQRVRHQRQRPDHVGRAAPRPEVRLRADGTVHRHGGDESHVLREVRRPVAADLAGFGRRQLLEVEPERAVEFIDAEHRDHDADEFHVRFLTETRRDVVLDVFARDPRLIRDNPVHRVDGRLGQILAAIVLAGDGRRGERLLPGGAEPTRRRVARLLRDGNPLGAAPPSSGLGELFPIRTIRLRDVRADRIGCLVVVEERHEASRVTQRD